MSLKEIAGDQIIYKLKNPEDLNLTFNECEKVLSLIREKGYKSSEIVVDITSGTKIMSATIAALAITYRLFAMMYIGGKRDVNGIVIKGTERP